ncbi:MAG: hypothetical protein QUU85_11285 [Candidatus Eisenbacteria bacterium]|nr:hypothetical protein [Candidatus Eisenbacteria bacterium]
MRLLPDPACGRSWGAQWYPGVYASGEAEPLVFSTAGETASLEWTLAEGGSLEGTIVPPESDDWHQHVLLVAPDDSTEVLCDQAVTGASPAYRFGGLVPGTYFLRVFARIEGRWANWWYPGVTGRGGATPIEVVAGETAGAATWMVP